MTNEEFLFYTDVNHKKAVARSSRNRRTHNGSRGNVKFPSDYLSKKELRKMNGDIKTYNLNTPMTYSEFKKMPEDLRREYLGRIIERFDAPRGDIGKMLGCGRTAMANQFKKLGFGLDTRAPRRSWKKDEFEKWCRRTEEIELPLEEENEAVIPEESTIAIPESTVAIPDEESVEETCCVNTQLQTAGELNYRLEYFHKCEELEKAKMALENAQKEMDDLHDLLIEARAIKRTLYVIFGRSFDNE